MINRELDPLNAPEMRLGSGKARPLCRDGNWVGLFCYNRGPGQHLQNQVSQWQQANPVFTGEFHNFVRSLGISDNTGEAYFDEDMPRLLIEKAASLLVGPPLAVQWLCDS